MNLKFLGGSGTVTGSRFLLESEGLRILVDCGMFQGVKSLRLKNWEEFPVPPESIDAVILTHAHLDHSGYLPRLIQQGFRGTVISTEATYDLCKILLLDSGYLQEEEAKYRNRSKSSKHHPALPLYTEKDAERSLRLFQPAELDEVVEVGPYRITFLEAGHILGAASVRVEAEGKSILFSGDIGRYDDLLMTRPKDCPEVDYVVMESTYGNRNHPEGDPIEEVAGILKEVVGRGGVLMIPSFAVGRAQLLMFILYEVFKKYPKLKVPLFLNSPMAVDVTSLFQKYTGEHRLTKDHCNQVCRLATFVNSVEESRELNEKKGPMVIVSASGMLSGGRILHHLKAFGGNPANAIMLAGFQAPGTRGHTITNGSRELKIHGEYHPINAQVFQMDSLSAHADQGDLVRWLGAKKDRAYKKVFLVHGEANASDSLRLVIKDRLGFECEIPQIGDEVELN